MRSGECFVDDPVLRRSVGGECPDCRRFGKLDWVADGYAVPYGHRECFVDNMHRILLSIVLYVFLLPQPDEKQSKLILP